MLPEIFSVLIFPGLLSAIIIGLLYEGIGRKITARMQHRRGPPIYQPFFDWIKTMTKENITPKAGNSFLMTLCPIVSFAAAVSAIIFVPVTGFSIGFEGNVFVFLYFLLISVVFLAVAGFATGSPFGVIGSMREVMQIIAYELPFIISVITLGFISGFQIVAFSAFYLPFTVFGFMLGILGKLGLPPFHIPEAEQEIVEGPMTEYTGPRLGMFQLSHAALVWVLISSAVVMIFGGGNIIEFFIKSLLILIVLMFIKNVFSRAKINQAFKFYWLVVMPLVLIDLVRVLTGFMVG
ncbi:MAG: NADH-quinone oxidoreductase subunit H [Candidatus Aenigmarchaeota archaeon]|nr:NADH-quinone oxidoreductase subunit H [Candidatus Aenigmarchaeota archaeon]